MRANAVTGAGETASATFEEHPQARWPGMVLSQVLWAGLSFTTILGCPRLTAPRAALRGLPLTPPVEASAPPRGRAFV